MGSTTGGGGARLGGISECLKGRGIEGEGLTRIDGKKGKEDMACGPRYEIGAPDLE